MFWRQIPVFERSKLGNYYLPNYQVQQQLLTTWHPYCDYVVAPDQVMHVKNRPSYLTNHTGNLWSLHRRSFGEFVFYLRCWVDGKERDVLTHLLITTSKLAYVTADQTRIRLCLVLCWNWWISLVLFGGRKHPKTWYCPDWRTLPNFVQL